MNLNTISIILNTDSYKSSHPAQYPPGTEYVECYVESRGGKYDKTVFFGLQMFIKNYLLKPITMEMIDEAELFTPKHGLPFQRENWEYILNEHDGYLPLEIKSVDEGTVVPVSNALAVVVNTDPKCYWLPSHIEPATLRGIWYPTTVATNSWTTRNVITKYMRLTTTLCGEELEAAIDPMLHDFGSRGVSSLESAGIGGAAHLINFTGSDNIPGVLYANRFYDCDMAAFSVPASEHSSITTWTKAGETDAYQNMIKQYGGKFIAFSVVSDSYDIMKAVEHIWGEELKNEVIACGSMLVIRPDSGNPADIVLKVLQLLSGTFGYTTNAAGFKVLNNVRVLQGDGITTETVGEILSKLFGYNFSAENILLGQGGALLQQLDRDTCRWAYKASAAQINGKWIEVFKDPVTDTGKRSKKGRLSLYLDGVTGEYVTSAASSVKSHWIPQFKVRYKNGKLVSETTLEQVRKTRFSTT